MNNRYQRARGDVYDPQWHRRSSKDNREMVYAAEFRRRRFKNRARQAVYDENKGYAGEGCARVLIGTFLFVLLCVLIALV